MKSNKKLNEFLFGAGIIDRNKYQSKYAMIDEVVNSSASALDRMIREYKAIILIIPSRFLWMHDEKRQNDERLLHELFINQLKKKELDYIDLKPVFELSKDPLKYHFSMDGHWNEEGHRLASEEIKKYLHLFDND